MKVNACDRCYTLDKSLVAAKKRLRIHKDAYTVIRGDLCIKHANEAKAKFKGSADADAFEKWLLEAEA